MLNRKNSSPKSNHKKPTWVAVIIMVVAVAGTFIGLQLTQGQHQRDVQEVSGSSTHDSRGVLKPEILDGPFIHEYAPTTYVLVASEGDTVWQMVRDALRRESVLQLRSNDIFFYDEGDEAREGHIATIVNDLREENPDLDLDKIQPGFALYRVGDTFAICRDAIAWGRI